MKVVFVSNSSNTVEAKSAWQNFLKGRMGKGKSLKELSVEFKKLKAEGKLDDEGNVVEAAGPGGAMGAKHRRLINLKAELAALKAKISALEKEIASGKSSSPAGGKRKAKR